MLRLVLCVVMGVAVAPAAPSTFSMVAFDPEPGALGVAVQSKFPAVGDGEITGIYDARTQKARENYGKNPRRLK